MPNIISSREVFRGRVFNIRADKVALPDGVTHTWEIVEHTGGVAMLPLDADGNVYLIRQYRHAAGDSILEVPAGTVEPAEEPSLTAARELREEIGMQADTLELLGRFFVAPGYSSELMHLYLATGLSHAPLPGDADEQIEVVPMQLEAVYAMLAAGEIRDSKTALALLLYRAHAGQS